MAFDESYWKANYSTPSEMDGVGNAWEHARYLKYCFELSDYKVSSVIDLGFGLGKLFKAVLKTLPVYRAHGIEPSAYAFNKTQKDWKRWPPAVKFKLEQKNLTEWALEQKTTSKWFDLGLCTSVFQYLTDDDMQKVLPVLAKSCRYLYFSVPTDIELERQRQELDFHDEYAISRTSNFYKKALSPFFTFISGRLLESKLHFNLKNTPFTDLLFRF